MAMLELQGLDSLQEALRRISEIPWEVTESALDAMADAALPEIRSKGETMGVRDPESNVHILDQLKRKKAKQDKSGGHEDITFSGSRQRGGSRTRNAEIAFINEYGKRGQPARPFIGQAMTQNAEKITEPAERILGDWIEKNFKN